MSDAVGRGLIRCGRFEALPNAPGDIGFENPEFVVCSAPGDPWIPAEAFRIESPLKRAVVVYPSPTGPSEELVRLSRDADLMLHGATRRDSGHSSAEQAGASADQSPVKRLWLIHSGPSADHKALGVRAPSPSSVLVEVMQEGMELALWQAEGRSLQSIKLARNAYGTILWGRGG